MRKSKRVMRRLILIRLYDHLEQHYAFTHERDTFLDGTLPQHELAAILAFKSDTWLNELKRALDRLDDGTFGTCISCKRMIAQSTLDTDPTGRLCDECERAITHPFTHRYAPDLPSEYQT